jgi:hypothetical protein
VRALGQILAACADVEAGTLAVNATGVGTRDQTRAWVAPGVAARVSWPHIALGTHAELLVDLEVGLRVPLLRDTFYFLDNPNNYQVYDTPSVVGRGAVDVGMRFW